MNTIEIVQNFETENLFQKIYCEKSEIIARILVCMKTPKAAVLLGKLTLKAQIDVIEYIAKMEEISPSELNEIDKLLTGQDSNSLYANGLSEGGVDAVVEILNLSHRDTFSKIINVLENDNPELADKILRRMSVFEDIVMLSDKAIEYILKKVDDQDLALALKGVDTPIEDKLFWSMPKDRVKKIKQDMEYMGPQREAVVEDAQYKIIKFIRKLRKDKEI